MTKDIISQMDDIVYLLKDILTKRKKQKDLELIERELESIKNRETTILVCGEFKRGKSSFINAFLEQELCPVDTGITTAAVSIIRYGEKLKITRYFGQMNELKSEEIGSLDDIIRYVKGRAEEIDNTVWLDIEIPNEKLKSGIALIDTPGIGGFDPRHALLTGFFMQKADITLFVTDKGEPMAQPEIDFFETKIAAHAKKHAILVSKADEFDKEAQPEEKKAEWIADVKNKCKSAAAVIPVSANHKLQYLKKKDEKILKRSNFEAVEAEIAELALAIKKELLVELKSMVLILLKEARKPLATLIEQIDKPNEDMQKTLQEDAKMLGEQLKKYKDPQSKFRIELNTKFEDEKSSVEQRMDDIVIPLSTIKLKELARSEQALANHEWLNDQINNAIFCLGAELDTMIVNGFNQLMSAVGSDKEYTLDDSSIRFNYKMNVDLKPAGKSKAERSLDVARHALPAIGIWGIVAWGASFVLTGGVATAIGFGTGIAMWYKSLTEAEKREETNEFIEKLQPEISKMRVALTRHISKRFSAFNKELQQALISGAERLLENLNEIQASLGKLQRDEEQKRKLDQELKPIDTLITNVELYCRE